MIAAAATTSVREYQRTFALFGTSVRLLAGRPGAVGAKPAPLRDALPAAPARVPARPDPRARWRAIHRDGVEIRRPPGLRLDLGGSAKGYAADRAAATLARQETFAVDAGGDVVVGGTAGVTREVRVAHPLDGPDLRFPLAAGAVATSGLRTRLWRQGDGYAHHLIDPARGRPAWTGVAQATAVAGSGLEAETLAKVALLSGPKAGAAALERHGGVLILDDGATVVVGPLRERAEIAP